MKPELAESLGLSEKQISGWFCHRRSKDKRLSNGEPSAIGRQDRSSGIVQDHGSGFKQDSCGSTKQGEDRNFDPMEVESGRLAGQVLSPVNRTYEPGNYHTSNYSRMHDASSGGSSSLSNMSFHHNGDFFDVASSKCQTPKISVDTKRVKVRSGPSGYLKVKGQVENAVITAVKKQLGSHYREDGPPLGIEFDPLPPGAFESSEEEPDNEPYYAGEHVLRPAPDVSKIQKRNFSEGYEYSYTGSHNSDTDGTNFKMMHRSDVSGSYLEHKYPRINSTVQLPEGSRKCVPDYESGNSYRKPQQGGDVMRMDSVYSHPQTSGGKVSGKWNEPLYSKYNDVDPKVAHAGNIEHMPSNVTLKGNEYPNSEGKGMPQRMLKEAKVYRDGIMNESYQPVGVKVPPKNGASISKRARDEFSQQLNGKKLSVDNRLGTYQIPRPAAENPSSLVKMTKVQKQVQWIEKL